MSFDGYLSFGGIELINAERTQAYIKTLMPAFGYIRRTSIYDTIHVALGDPEYRSPVIDEAEWVNVADPATHNFYGLYPLSIEGIGDSTMQAEVVEGILDGGVVGAERDATRSIRVRGLLVGEDQLSVEAGLTWLRNALRANGCGMHGDLCGYHDLRYFLAPPDVCSPKFGPEDSWIFSNVTYGAVTPTSPVNYDYFPEGMERPMSAWWIFPTTGIDGVIVRWGEEAVEGREAVDYGPLYLRRTNFVRNPSFANNVATWSEEMDGSPSAGPVREVTPDRTFARVGSGLADIASNWVPDPSFENGDPTINGWRSSTPGGLASVVDVTAPNGTHVITVPGVAGQTELEVNLTGPWDKTTGFVSMEVAQNVDDLVLEMFDNGGMLLETHTIPASELTDPWNAITVEMTSLIFNDNVLRWSTAGTQELRMDAIIASKNDEPFFDGDTPDGGGFTYSYDGGPAGASRRVQTFGTNATLVGEQTDAPFGPVVFSAEIRSAEAEPTVTVRLIDPDDNVLSTLTIQPGHEWARYALGADFGRMVRVEITGNAEFDVDRVMIEAGSRVEPYFDGNTLGQPTNYIVEWTGAPELSTSRMTWVGNTYIKHNYSFRPYLAVEQGALPNVLLSLGWADTIPMDVQIEPYDRTYHEVSTSVGVKRIRDVNLDVGAAIEVDFILTAGTPHAFSTQAVEIPWDPAPQQFITDELINRALTPTGNHGVQSWKADGFPSGYANFPAVTAPVSANPYGTNTIRATYSNVTDVSPGLESSFPVTAGEYLQVHVRHIKVNANKRLRIWVQLYNASNVFVGTLGTVNYKDFVANVPSDLSSGEATAVPATATRAKIAIQNETTPWANGNYLEVSGVTAYFPSGDDLPYIDGDMADTDAYEYEWAGTPGNSASRRSIPVPSNSILLDPDLPVVPSPPRPPVVIDSAVDLLRTDWARRYVEIPAANVALWEGTVPTLTLSTSAEDNRQVRVRFYANPFDRTMEQVDPSEYCGEFILSYLPANSVFTISGMTQRAYVQIAGGSPIPADHLLYGTDGGPMTWPELSCGISYIMTVDSVPALAPSDLSIGLSVNRRE